MPSSLFDPNLSADGILEAVARAVWAKDHNDADCPPDKLVTVQGAADQLTETPAGNWQHGLNRDLNETMGASRRWYWTWVETDLQDPRPKLIAVGVGARLDMETVRKRRLNEQQEWSGLPPLLLSVERVHSTWCGLLDSRPPHPLAGLVREWQGRPKPLENSYLITVEDRKGGKYNRSPSLAAIIGQPLENANLRAIEVDGEPIVSVLPRTEGKRVGYRRRQKLAVQGGLSFMPKQISGDATGDMVIATLASQPLTGDERSPLRGDILALANFAYALSGPTYLDETRGSILLTGAVTPAGIERWWVATSVARAIVIIVDPRTGRWKGLMQSESDGRVVVIGPPSWWRGEGAYNHWRLSGGLFRPQQLGRVSQGTAPGYWGGVHRTLNGFEAMLCYGPSAGRGRGGRIPDNLKPERKGGPGPEVFVTWQMVLMGAGEYVPEDTPLKSAEGRRYRRRRDALEKAGYLVKGRGAAPAGDTVEIVRVVRGKGLVIRASARFCEAVARSQRRGLWVYFPASRVLGAKTDHLGG